MVLSREAMNYLVLVVVGELCVCGEFTMEVANLNLEEGICCLPSRREFCWVDFARQVLT